MERAFQVTGQQLLNAGISAILRFGKRVVLPAQPPLRRIRPVLQQQPDKLGMSVTHGKMNRREIPPAARGELRLNAKQLLGACQIARDRSHYHLPNVCTFIRAEFFGLNPSVYAFSLLRSVVLPAYSACPLVQIRHLISVITATLSSAYSGSSSRLISIT
jgi:hypothetical protein